VRRACTAWHFTSPDEERESWPWDASPRFIIPNGVEPEQFAVDRREAREQVWRALPALQECPYVLFLGRLHSKKRLDFLVAAFLEGAPPDFKLVIAGPDEENIMEKIAARFLLDADAARRVVRAGLVTGNQKTALLAGASLFALPSEHENFGIAALEALAAGTPLLLSPDVDLAKSLGNTSWCHTAPLAVEAWSALLARLLVDSVVAPQDAEQARQWIAGRFAWRHLANQLVGRYNWVCNGCPSAEPVGVV
jgi:glycosyltransferase involved in cell wall biosynthesis